MYFIIFSIPIAAILAALQVYLCKKSEKKAVRLIPLFITIGVLAMFGIVISDPVSAFIARFIDWGVFALIVYLAIGAVGCAIGTAVGWIIYKIIKKHK